MSDGMFTGLCVVIGVPLFFWFANWSGNRAVARFEKAVQAVTSAYRAEADAAPQDMASQQRIAAKHRLMAKAKGEQLGRSVFW